MGFWTFMEPRLRAMGYEVRYVGRDASASPATGSYQVHVREQKELVEAAIAGQVPHLVRAVVDGRLRGGGDRRLPAREEQAAQSSG
jgi:2-oxoglutarate dehydrogenase E1 component